VELNRNAEYELVRSVVSAVLKLTIESFLNLADNGVLFAEGKQQVVVSRWNETIRFIGATSFDDVNRSCLSDFTTESSQSGMEKRVTILINNLNSNCHVAYEMFLIRRMSL